MGPRIVLVCDYLMGIIFPLGYTILVRQGRLIPETSVIAAVTVGFVFANATWGYTFFPPSRSSILRWLGLIGLVIQIVMAVALSLAAPFPLK